MPECRFNADGPPWVCEVCGVAYPRDLDHPPRRRCQAAEADSEEYRRRLTALLNALNEWASNGLATRPWGEIGRLLTLCQKCPDFRGDRCARDNCQGPPKMRARLCSRSAWCDEWGGR